MSICVLLKTFFFGFDLPDAVGEDVCDDVQIEADDVVLEIGGSLGPMKSKIVGGMHDLRALSMSASAEIGPNRFRYSSACFALLFRGLVGGLP